MFCFQSVEGLVLLPEDKTSDSLNTKPGQPYLLTAGDKGKETR